MISRLLKRLKDAWNPPYAVPYIEPDKYTAANPPTCASQLIYLALNDLDAIEKQPTAYEVNMNVWHSDAGFNEKCTVCFAGSIMANTLKISRNKDIWSGRDLAKATEFCDDWKHRFGALNAIRSGDIVTAGREWSPFSIIEHNRTIVSYHVDPMTFKKQMLKLAKDYERAEAEYDNSSICGQ